MKLMFCASCGERIYLDEPHLRRDDQYWHGDCLKKRGTPWGQMVTRSIFIALLVVLCVWSLAHGHTNDGTWDDTPYKAWYEKQHNKNNLNCCDWSDAYPTEYTIRGGKYFVFIHSKEHQVPDFAVIDGINPTGHSVVWYWIDEDGSTYIRCFSPVSAT